MDLYNCYKYLSNIPVFTVCELFSRDDAKSLILHTWKHLARFSFLGWIFVRHLVKNHSTLSENMACVNWQYLKTKLTPFR